MVLIVQKECAAGENFKFSGDFGGKNTHFVPKNPKIPSVNLMVSVTKN